MNNTSNSLLRKSDTDGLMERAVINEHGGNLNDVMNMINAPINSAEGMMVRKTVVGGDNNFEKTINYADIKEENTPATERVKSKEINEKDTIKPVPVKPESKKPVTSEEKSAQKVADIAAKASEAAKNAVNQPQQKQIQTVPQTQSAQAKPEPAPVKQTISVAKIRSIHSLDDIVNVYIEVFKKHFGIELSSNICYDNMRKMCDVNIKDPKKCLYFLENTYRLTTMIYLVQNLPLIFVSSVLAPGNRKNILRYVTQEVELCAKKFDDIRDLKMERMSKKFAENTDINDSITITPGVTALTPEMRDLLLREFETTCNNMKRFNKDLTDIISKFDDDTLHDVVYIYSNWWYLLQCFENNMDARRYIKLITDDTRKNLKL